MYGYIKKFKGLGFGLFVRFGLYSVVGKGEWYLHLNPKANKEKYNALKGRFCVKKTWAKDLVKTAKVAGCKYITLTTRHHDGFLLYDTRGLNDFDAPHSACGEVKDEKGNAVMKKWWEVTDKDIDTMMNATTWPYADLGYFRGGGYSSRFVTRAEMPATMIRLNLIKGLGTVLQIVEGWTVKLPDEVTDKLWKRTDYTWPCTWFAPRVTGNGAFKSAYDVNE